MKGGEPGLIRSAKNAKGYVTGDRARQEHHGEQCSQDAGTASYPCADLMLVTPILTLAVFCDNRRRKAIERARRV